MLALTLPRKFHLLVLVHLTFLIAKLLIRYFFTPTSPDEIFSLKNILKDGKSPRHDEINPSTLKKSLLNIIRPLSHIFNLSLSTGVVPSSLKVAKVTPILKSGDPSSFCNYRPFPFSQHFLSYSKNWFISI